MNMKCLLSRYEHDFTTFNLRHRPYFLKLPISWTLEVHCHLWTSELTKFPHPRQRRTIRSFSATAVAVVVVFIIIILPLENIKNVSNNNIRSS